MSTLLSTNKMKPGNFKPNQQLKNSLCKQIKHLKNEIIH